MALTEHTLSNDRSLNDIETKSMSFKPTHARPDAESVSRSANELGSIEHQALKLSQVNHKDLSSSQEVTENIAIEAPVAMVFNGLSYAVMMATPSHLEDFAYGFALSEGIVDDLQQIYDCETHRTPQGYSAELRIASAAFHRLKEKRRNLTGRTGCGLCGVESLAQAIPSLEPISSAQQTPLKHILSAARQLRQHQDLMTDTGSCHAAAWCNNAGEIHIVREDVGRHNALDKVIGALARKHHSNTQSGQGFILMTSRASYELVHKCARAKIPVLAAISGVTSLAIDVAQDSGLALLGFTREYNSTIYTHPHRIILD